MNSPQSYEQLIEASQELDLYSKLISQLNKDLALANIDLEFDEEVLPESLKYLLHEKLFHLINEHFDRYLNLLYVIDVSEEKIRSLDGSDIAQLSEQVCFLVLKREWQKVYTKYKYSQK